MFFSRVKTRPVFVSAVVTAGISSHFEEIDCRPDSDDSVPMVVRNIEVLCDCPQISEIVLACPSGMLPFCYDLVRDFGLDMVRSVVSGGQNRQESVFLAIDACDDCAAYYVLLDGMRPLVSAQAVERCIAAAKEFGAATAGAPPEDIVKRLDSEGFAVSIPAQDSLVCIQTPQAFEAKLYRKAMELARRERHIHTDDCKLVELLGKRVKVISCTAIYNRATLNTPEDVTSAIDPLAYKKQLSKQTRTR